MDLDVPFKHTGVNVTGHFWIREASREVKMYLVIFTGLSVRAVHIEAAPDMAVLSFLHALVRFTNLYYIQATIYSDNPKAFQ